MREKGRERERRFGEFQTQCNLNKDVWEDAYQEQ